MSTYYRISQLRELLDVWAGDHVVPAVSAPGHAQELAAALFDRESKDEVRPC